MCIRDSYIAVDPVTERSAVVNFPVCPDNIYKIDVEETKKLIERYRPELIIFGKSMVLYQMCIRDSLKRVSSNVSCMNRKPRTGYTFWSTARCSATATWWPAFPGRAVMSL